MADYSHVRDTRTSDKSLQESMPDLARGALSRSNQRPGLHQFSPGTSLRVSVGYCIPPGDIHEFVRGRPRTKNHRWNLNHHEKEHLLKRHAEGSIQQGCIRDFWNIPVASLNGYGCSKVSNGNKDSGVQQLRIAVPPFCHRCHNDGCFSPAKPDFPEGGSEFQYPKCGKTATYQRTDLMYRD